MNLKKMQIIAKATEEEFKEDILERKIKNAEELLNTIWNITFHTDYETLSQKVANDEIKHIHELITDYFKIKRIK